MPVFLSGFHDIVLVNLNGGLISLAVDLHRPLKSVQLAAGLIRGANHVFRSTHSCSTLEFSGHLLLLGTFLAVIVQSVDHAARVSVCQSGATVYRL